MPLLTLVPLLPRTECTYGACGAHGVCQGGMCQCVGGYSGPICTQEPEHPCGEADCGDHRRCEDAACTCLHGYSGDDCECACGEGTTLGPYRQCLTPLLCSTAGQAAEAQRPAVRRRHDHSGHDVGPAARQGRAHRLQRGRQHAARVARGRQRGQVALRHPRGAEPRGGRHEGLPVGGGRVDAATRHLPVPACADRQHGQWEHGRAGDADCDGGYAAAPPGPTSTLPHAPAPLASAQGPARAQEQARAGEALRLLVRVLGNRQRSRFPPRLPGRRRHHARPRRRCRVLPAAVSLRHQSVGHTVRPRAAAPRGALPPLTPTAPSVAD